MATRAYCEHVGPELEIWSRRLHELSAKIDRIPSIDKYKLQPQIEELHIILTELDDRLQDLSSACPSVEEASSAHEAVGSGPSSGVHH